LLQNFLLSGNSKSFAKMTQTNQTPLFTDAMRKTNAMCVNKPMPVDLAARATINQE
jgi:hypothetical protein